MYSNIFDSHAHYDDQHFDEDRHALLEALPGQGITGIINPATSVKSARACIALAERYPFMYCAVGVHPHEAAEAPEDYISQLRALASAPRVCAIGEIGLDYHYDFSPRELQRQVFEQQLQLAAELGLPVIIHDRESHADTLALLYRYRPAGVLHCFSGSAEMAREVVGLGMYVGFTGAVTFKNARKPLEAVAAVPLERLLIETDCPYMAPVPHRGQRCDSSMIPLTAQVMADIKGVTAQQLLDATARNAKTLFGI